MENEPTGDAIVPYSPSEHYPIINGWWSLYYNEAPIPQECLPDSGVIVMHKGQPAAAAFVYKAMGAKMAHIHWAIVDPALGAGRRVGLLSSAIEGAIDLAKEYLAGEGFIWCCTDSAVVARMYNKAGMHCAGEADVFFMPIGAQSFEFLK